MDYGTKCNVHIGDVFDKYTVISEPFKNKKNGNYYVQCRCQCGAEKVVSVYSLLNGKSHGCHRCAKLNKDLDKTKYRKLMVQPGDRFGMLTVLREIESRRDGSGRKRRYVECQCDCGNIIEVSLNALVHGLTTSCGCFRNHDKKQKRKDYPDGYRQMRLYGVWRGMKERCYNKNRKEYKDYGGRGIIVCEEWRTDFRPFYDWAFANGYREEILLNGINKWTLDRIDPNGNYCPENCRWVTNEEQQKNKRNSKHN